MSTSEHRIAAFRGPALSARAHRVSFGEDTLVVDLEDGRQIAVPIVWFPRLANATAEQRFRWELVGRGIGISWPEIDEDISVENLLSTKDEVLTYQDAPKSEREQFTGGTAVVSRTREVPYTAQIVREDDQGMLTVQKTTGEEPSTTPPPPAS